LGRILLIVILLIVYGSLYPFHFHPAQSAASPLWMLFHSWPPVVDRSVLVDIVLNVFIYLPVGLFGSLSLGKRRSILLAAALSACMEVLQLFDYSRMCSTLDLVSNISGAVFGVSLAHVYGKNVTRLLAESPVRASLRPSPALLLLCCWIGYQSFPLIPNLRLTPFWAKVGVLLHPASFSLVQMMVSTFEWLAVARLLEEIRLGSRTLSLLMLLVPARILIAGRTFTWPELAGAACAWLLWNGWLMGYEKRPRLLAWLAAAVLLLRGLAPYHWQSAPHAFSWAPFSGFFEADKNSSVTMFFDKSFLYGTVVWFFCRDGYSPLAAGLGVASLLGIIELLQTHLPGRTPEITDPAYTLILAVVLKLLDSADRRARLAAARDGLQKCE
jgi:VanZ family protein